MIIHGLSLQPWNNIILWSRSSKNWLFSSHMLELKLEKRQSYSYPLAMKLNFIHSYSLKLSIAIHLRKRGKKVWKQNQKHLLLLKKSTNYMAILNNNIDLKPISVLKNLNMKKDVFWSLLQLHREDWTFQMCLTF